MQPARPLDVLFLVDFSDFAFRCIPLLAELADTLAIRLELLHVCAEGEEAAAKERLNSFFPEADRYSDTTRVVDSGRLHEVVARRCARAPVGLIVAPAAQWLTTPALGQPSRRLKMLESTRTPVLTIGAATDVSRLGAPVRNIACWVELQARHQPQLAHAVELSRKTGAALHLLTAVPEISVTNALRTDLPLHPAAITEHLVRSAGPMAHPPRVHVLEDDSARARQQVLERIGADRLLICHRDRPVLDWFGVRPDWLKLSPCPVLMVPEAIAGRWSLVERRVWQAAQREEPEQRRAG